MRAPGPPLRFLLIVVTLWIGGRAVVLNWSGDGQDRAGSIARRPTVMAGPGPHVGAPAAPVLAATGMAVPQPAGAARPAPMLIAAAGRPGGSASPVRGRADTRAVERVGVALAVAAGPGGGGPAAAATLAGPAPAPQPQFPGEPRPAALAPVQTAQAAPRWSGSVFLFGRSGGGAVPLAGGGQLGASQAGARIAYRIDDAGHVAAAARIYAPIDSLRGTEVAAGIDLHPLPAVPLRVSIERRVAIGKDGRNAWSAYAAGGFFKGIGRSIELDGYAQAGVVGVHARDLFADSALRVARRFDLGGGRAVLAGAGAWGAAQPGVERVDMGPRVALRLPAGGTAISIAGEWRARVAGSARPRSGPALTIAADF